MTTIFETELDTSRYKDPVSGTTPLRKKSRQHHPDKNQGAAQEEAARRFREVSEASSKTKLMPSSSKNGLGSIEGFGIGS